MVTKQELEKAKPVLFNAEMNEAILNGCKTCTRRLINPQPKLKDGETGVPVMMDDGTFQFKVDGYSDLYDCSVKPKYFKGDILYVQETWKVGNVFCGDRHGWDIEFKDGSTAECVFDRFDRYLKFSKYKPKPGCKIVWQSPYFIPKEGARTFLRVVDVRIERLRDLTASDARREGAEMFVPATDEVAEQGQLVTAFSKIWDNTVPKDKLQELGWNGNPWVFVYSFEVL